MKAVTNIESFEAYSERFECLSFDLFDTLIYRQTLQLPEIHSLSAIYACGLIRLHGGRDIAPEVFLRYRRKFTSELKLSIQAGTREPELSKVFERALAYFGVSIDVIVNLALKITHFEFDLELRTLTALPEAKALLKKLKLKNKKLVVISDMYFSEDRVKEILVATSLDQYIDHLFVSAEYGCTKRDGLLFTIALQSLKLSPSELIHIGDNFHADVHSAKKTGINAVYYSARQKKECNGISLHSNNRLSEIAADLVLAFIYQIALSSAEKALKRIYFLSRDATLIGEMFEYANNINPLISNLTKNTEIRFLSLSRASCVFLKLQSQGSQITQVLKLYLELNQDGYTLEGLCGFLGLGEDVYSSDSSRLKVSCVADVDNAVLTLEGNETELKSKIVTAAHDHANNVIEYLRQESVIGAAGPVGFVDIGYSGSVARNIASYVYRELSDGDISDFSLHMMLLCGGNRFEYETKRCNSLIKFLSPIIIDKNLSSLQKLNFSWFEIFFQKADLGPLSSYGKVNDIWTPVFEQTNVPETKHQWFDVCRAKLESASHLELFLSKKYVNLVAKQFVKRLAKPSVSNVRELGNVSFYKGAMDNEFISIVDLKISPLKLLKPSYIKIVARDDVWVEGSLAAINKSWLRLPISIVVAIYFNVDLTLKYFQARTQKSCLLIRKIVLRLK